MIDPFTIPGFREVINLVQNHHLFVKISAPYQNSKQEPLYSDTQVIVKMFIINSPDIVVFSSDWPYTASKEGNGPGSLLVPSDFQDIDNDAIRNQTSEMAGTQAQAQHLFVDNPRRLWGWTDTQS
jgi:predicted TIM-barrel fold metal-dependent hydrolase